MKAQCLLYHLYRALHSGRNALIGQNLIAVSSHCSPLIGQNLIAVSSHCSPLIGQNLIAVSSHCSHYMENSMPYLACLPVGGASLANDDVMRGGGGCKDRNVA